MANAVYILNIENTWWEKESGSFNNRNTHAYRVFATEDAARNYMQKFIDAAMNDESGVEPKIREEKDKDGLLVLECSFNAGYDAIANTETHTSVKVYRHSVSDEIPDDPFSDVMGEIYIG